MRQYGVLQNTADYTLETFKAASEIEDFATVKKGTIRVGALPAKIQNAIKQINLGNQF